MDEHRELQFSSLNDVIPEVDRLMAAHRTLGNWSLGQICNHLAATMRLAVESPAKRAPWIVRKLIGPALFRCILRKGRLRPGVKSPAMLIPRPGLDDRAEAEALCDTIQLLMDRLPDPVDHAFFGKVARADYLRLQCMHCAHHLGFVISTNDG